MSVNSAKTVCEHYMCVFQVVDNLRLNAVLDFVGVNNCSEIC
jgi:hypothetical protein